MTTTTERRISMVKKQLQTPSKIITILTLVLLLVGSLTPALLAATYTYDALGRVTSVSYSNGQKTDYSYDAGGNILEIKNYSPLQLESTLPAAGEMDAPITTNISCKFNMAVQPGPKSADITLLSGENKVAVTISSSGDTLVIDPMENLIPNTLYMVKLPPGAVSASGGTILNVGKTFSFTTFGLRVASTSPDDKESDVGLVGNITVTFNQDIQPGSNIGGITLKTGDTPCQLNTSISGSVLTLDPVYDLKRNKQYSVTIPAGCVKDPLGYELNYDYTFTFTTEYLKVISSTPENDATGVPVNQTIELIFNAPIKPGDKLLKCSLVEDSGKKIATHIPLVIGSTMKINPLLNLGIGKTYTLTVPVGAVKERYSGDQLLQDYQLVFSTQPDPVPPEIINTNPVNGASNIALNTTATITFSENVRMGPDFLNINVRDQNRELKPTLNIVVGNVLTIKPITKLTPGTTYTVTIPAQSIKDRAGNFLTEDYTFSFTSTTE